MEFQSLLFLPMFGWPYLKKKFASHPLFARENVCVCVCWCVCGCVCERERERVGEREIVVFLPEGVRYWQRERKREREREGARQSSFFA